MLKSTCDHVMNAPDISTPKGVERNSREMHIKPNASSSQLIYAVEPVKEWEKEQTKVKKPNTSLSCIRHYSLPSLEEPEVRFASFVQCLTIQG